MDLSVTGTNAILRAGGTLDIDHSGGAGIIYIYVSGSAAIDANGNIDFTGVTAAGNAEIRLNSGDSKLYIAGNINRNALGSRYGILNCRSNSDVIFDGSGAQIMADTRNGDGGDKFNYEEVTINKAGGDITLEDSVTIEESLILTSGDIVLGADILIIGSNCSVGGGSSSSYVHADGTGDMIKNFSAAGSVTFPVGDAGDYSPFTFTLNSATFGGSDFISVSVTDAAPTDINTTHAYTSRYWTINSSAFSAIDYDVSYVYVDADIVGTESFLVATRWNGTKWSKYDGVNAGTNTLPSSTGITDIPLNHDFSGIRPMTYISSTVTQNNTSGIQQYSNDNQIIGIEIVTVADTIPTKLNTFYFDTDGSNGTGSDDPSGNITKASVYYTGTSNTFATTTSFGSISNPNGAFQITNPGGMPLSGRGKLFLAYV